MVYQPAQQPAGAIVINADKAISSAKWEVSTISSRAVIVQLIGVEIGMGVVTLGL